MMLPEESMFVPEKSMLLPEESVFVPRESVHFKKTECVAALGHRTVISPEGSFSNRSGCDNIFVKTTAYAV